MCAGLFVFRVCLIVYKTCFSGIFDVDNSQNKLVFICLTVYKTPFYGIVDVDRVKPSWLIQFVEAKQNPPPNKKKERKKDSFIVKRMVDKLS